jgi:Cys-rich repeat protein
MDGSHFDSLVRTLATTRLTRLTALRGLAVGALAAAIGLAAPDDAEARKKCGQCEKKKKKTKSGKVRIRCKAKANGTICSLAGATSASCLNGSCVAGARVGCQFNTDCPAGQVCQNAICVTPQAPAPGTQCAVDQDCAGGLVCRGGRCDFCNNNQECPEDQICLQGQCRGGALDFFFGLGQVDCTTGGDECPEPLACRQAVELAGDPFLCLLDAEGMGLCFPRSANVCGTNCQNFCGDAQVDNVNPICVLGACVVAGDSAACDACDGDNVAGICINGGDPACDSAPPP